LIELFTTVGKKIGYDSASKNMMILDATGWSEGIVVDKIGLSMDFL